MRKTTKRIIVTGSLIQRIIVPVPRDSHQHFILKQIDY